jgi:hypothetical protein
VDRRVTGRIYYLGAGRLEFLHPFYYRYICTDSKKDENES